MLEQIYEGNIITKSPKIYKCCNVMKFVELIPVNETSLMIIYAPGNNISKKWHRNGFYSSFYFYGDLL